MYDARALLTIQTQTWLSEVTVKLTLHCANEAASPKMIMYVFLKSVNTKRKTKIPLCRRKHSDHIEASERYPNCETDSVINKNTTERHIKYVWQIVDSTQF